MIQSTGAAEYIDFISAEEKVLPQKMSVLDTTRNYLMVRFQ